MNPTMHFGPKLEEIFPIIIPDLPIATRGQFASVRPEFLNPKFPPPKKTVNFLFAILGPPGVRSAPYLGTMKAYRYQQLWA